MDPSVSVLIPCHNAERFIASTLESVLRQDFSPSEIIVVDDHSTDGSARVVASFAPRVTLLSGPGRGASAARNHATQRATGTMFQYLDADDLLEPHALRSRVAALVTADADVAISGWMRLTEMGGEWRPGTTESGWPADEHAPTDLEVFRGFWAPPAAIMYRREIALATGGWRETLPVIQDARFLLDAARVGGRFTHVTGVGAQYREHAGGSLSTSDPARFWRDVLVNATEVEALWRRAGPLDADRSGALAGAYGHSARMGFIHDRNLMAEARRELGRFPEAGPSRFLRVAFALSDTLGPRIARILLAPWCR